MAEGDLSDRARRRAEELANDAVLRIRAPRDPAGSNSMEVKARSTSGRVSPSRDPRLPLPGCYLPESFRGVISWSGYLTTVSNMMASVTIPFPPLPGR